jgi:WhiB family transcriptional regulator, redox-sensing transcriptional regulator
MIDPRDWTEHAACLGASPELFFPISVTGPALEQASTAKSVCDRCPVRPECLDWALRAGEAHGIWGGTTPEERRYLRLGPPRPVPA